jgi:ABC-type lipoprotein release transport system permease subunit
MLDAVLYGILGGILGALLAQVVFWLLETGRIRRPRR